MNSSTRTVRVALVGMTGSGKTAAAGLLCTTTPNLFVPSDSAASHTRVSASGEQNYPELGLRVQVLDTVGVGDTSYGPEVVREHITEGVASLVGGVDFIFLCMKAGRFTHLTYVAYKYLLEGVLGEACLPNVWLLVTASGGDLSSDREAQEEWIRESMMSNRNFNEMAKKIGEDRIVFLENPSPSASLRHEEVYRHARDESRAKLLALISANFPPRYTIGALEEAQRAYAQQRRDMEQRRIQEAETLVAESVRVASEHEKRRLAEALRELERRHEDQMNALERHYQTTVFRSAGNYVQSRAGPLDLVMEAIKVVGVIVGAGNCSLQ